MFKNKQKIVFSFQNMAATPLVHYRFNSEELKRMGIGTSLQIQPLNERKKQGDFDCTASRFEVENPKTD